MREYLNKLSEILNLIEASTSLQHHIKFLNVLIFAEVDTINKHINLFGDQKKYIFWTVRNRWSFHILKSWPKIFQFLSKKEKKN